MRAPGAVKVLADRTRGGFVAKQRWWLTETTPVRTQAWGATRRAARTALAQAIAKREAQASAPVEEPVARSVTLSEAAAQWETWRRSYGQAEEASLRVQRSVWRSVLSPLLGSVETSALSIAHLHRAQAEIGRRGVNVALATSTLRSLLGWCYRQGLTQVDTSRLLEAPPRTEVTQGRVVTEAEHTALLALIDAALPEAHIGTGLVDLRDWATLAWHTGARISEVLALTWHDLVLGGEVPRVHIAATITLGEHGQIRAPRRKHSARAITVRLSGEAVACLVSRRERAGEPEDDAPVFATKHGRPVSSNNIRRTLRSLVAGTPLEGLSPHSWKRAWVTDAEAAHGLDAAADFGGHSVKVAERHYVQHREERILDPRAFRGRDED